MRHLHPKPSEPVRPDETTPTFCAAELVLLQRSPKTADARTTNQTERPRMAVLNIPKFPDDILHTLKTKALAERITLREYVIRVLSEPHSSPAASPAKKK